MKYLIEFTPLGSFAFSGETSLTNPGEASSRRASYLADSEFMPPQTTILGALRRCVLEWTGLYRSDGRYDDLEALAEVIGKDAFSLDAKKFSMGAIHAISGVFLTHRENDQTHFMFPVPQNIARKTQVYQPMSWNAEMRYADKPALTGYNVKAGLQSGFVSIDASDPASAASDLTTFVEKHIDGAPFIPHSDVFEKYAQTAIRQINNEDNKGFRIHHRVYFKNQQFSFAIIADLQGIEPLGSLIVSMGARNSLFRVTSTKLIATAPIESTSGCCLSVLSPMMLPENWRDMVDFAILARQKVRQMKRRNNSDFSYRHDSTLRFFASPGSVFYLKPDRVIDFIEAIQRQTALRQAGFSQYIILSKEA